MTNKYSIYVDDDPILNVYRLSYLDAQYVFREYLHMGLNPTMSRAQPIKRRIASSQIQENNK